jgi:hypothetical protein
MLFVTLVATGCGQEKAADTPVATVNRAMAASGGRNISVASDDQRRTVQRVTASEADAIEARIKMPDGAPAPLSRYARYYNYASQDGHVLIQGYFVYGLGDRPGRYLNTEDPGIDDGGCSVITIYYDPQRQRVAGIFCNGVA